MALASGTRLGPYEITTQIGVGGMGEVYRATDTNLKRQVALKVLPEAVAGDTERLARFQREAEVLAALNHPNIAAIYGLERAPSTGSGQAEQTALVMEFVDGPTLADRIAQGAIPVDEALTIAKQIAEALEAAHEQGIVHRDLKPANIKVRPDGTVKVLDFGLAKALGPEGSTAASGSLSMSPTITTPAMTQAGMILGTAAYMSPEQARGKPVDKRADIWAFGCVLYEMLTGRRAFEGEDVADTLGNVMKVEPDWSRLPASLSPSIATYLRRALQKNPKQRVGDMQDMRLALEGAFETTMTQAASLRPGWARGAPAAGAALVTALVVGGAAWSQWPEPRPVGSTGGLPGVARAALPLPRGAELSEGQSVDISADGTQIVYAASEGGAPRLYLRALGEFEARPLAGTDGAVAPFFSPDGQFVAFYTRDNKLSTVSTSRGVVTTLSDARPGGNPGGAWAEDGTIVFYGPLGLAAIPGEGGAARELLTAEQQLAGGRAAFPQFLPGGDYLLVSSLVGEGLPGEDSIDVMTLATGERKVLVRNARAGQYLASGHLVFQRAGALLAVTFDLAALDVTGTPVEVLPGLRTPYNGVGAFRCSRDGACVYVAGSALSERTVALVDRTGVARPLPLPAKSYAHPRFSPTGDQLAFWIEKSRCDIEVYDLGRGAVTLLPSDGDSHFPTWAPDGQRIAYISDSARTTGGGYSLFSQLANGGGDHRPIGSTSRGLGPLTPLAWSPAGDVLAYADRGDILLVSQEGNGEARPFAPSRFIETMPAFSPDGRWLAYVSDETGRFEVYVQPFPGPGQKYTISTSGGLDPVWARSGRELFFRNGDQMLSVEIATTPTFTASRPRSLFSGSFARAVDRPSYDVSPDGETFAMLIAGEGESAVTEISLLLNWFEELERLVPSR